MCASRYPSQYPLAGRAEGDPRRLSTCCRYDKVIGWDRDYFDDMNWMALALLYANSQGPASPTYVATAEALFAKVCNANVFSLGPSNATQEQQVYCVPPGRSGPCCRAIPRRAT